MTQTDLEDWLTSLSGDTLASRSHKPESDLAIKMTDTSGQRCLQLSKRSDPLGSVEKTLMDTSLWVSTRCYLTWKPQTTQQGRLLFRLSPQTPRTGETDVGLLHTPTATPNQMAPSMNSGWKEPPLWATPIARDAGGHTITKAFPNGFNVNLVSQVTLWQRAVKADGKSHSSGRLNPQWVEWLMGYPIGYTDLNN